MGNGEMIDAMINDALGDKFYGRHMGITAENIADKYGVTREDHDEFAAASQQKTEKAIKEGTFKDEIFPLRIKQRKDETCHQEPKLQFISRIVSLMASPKTRVFRDD